MAHTPKPLVFDTSVFIDYMHGRPIAKSWVEKVYRGEILAYVSPVTDYELWVGARDRNDIRVQKAILSRFRRANLHATITRRAGELVHPYIIKKDLSVSAIDSILTATAEYIGADILTRNFKHFEKIKLDRVKIIRYEL